jgi:hypothetical protein
MALTRIETDLIADSSITADKIASSAVTQTKIDPSVELGGGLDVIVDKFTGNGSTTQYSITETPTDEDKTIVIIEGVVQLKNSYSVSGNVVTFSSAIPNNYNFEIISFAGSGGGGGGSGPKITTVEVTNSGGTVIDDTAVDIAGGYIKITGTGFVTGCQVIVNNVAATSTTFVSSTVVRAQLPATAAGTYFVYVVNPDGGVAIKINGVTFSSSPTWVTGSSLSGAANTSYSVQLNATGASTYSLQAGSTLPSGLTLSSGGLLSGTTSGITQNTTYSFTVIATDSENQDSARTFSLILSIGDFNISPAVSGISNWTFTTNGNLSLTTPGEYIITAYSNFSKVVKLWGSGGAPKTAGSTGWGAGAPGGAAVGTISFVSGSQYIIRVSSAGNATSVPATAYGAGAGGGIFSSGTAGSGGGYTGIFLTSVSQANTILMAGGGGGGASSRSDGLGGRSGLAGGGTAGATATGFEAGSGTQSAGGAAAGSGTPTSGAALQGGNGSNGGGGGGGGYYGGGGGGSQGDGGYGGGGGSGYFNPSLVTSATLYVGPNSDVDKPAGVGDGAITGATPGNGAFLIKA